MTKLQKSKEQKNDYKDRSLILIFIGILQLLIGAVAAVYGPAEFYCFSFFSKGGRFYFEGFGFGSFIFAAIVCEIIGFYLIAILFIPLGIGNLKIRRWAKTISLVLSWFWLAIGLILIINMFILIPGIPEEVFFKDALVKLFIIGTFLLIFFLIVPGLFILFYRSKDVRLTFETKDPKSYWTEKYPFPILVLCFLLIFYLISMHILFFYNSIFPFFGDFLFGLSGTMLIDISIILLVCLVWGTFKLKRWAWWGSLAYFTLMTASSIMTFPKYNFSDIYQMMDYPTIEIEFLRGLKAFQHFNLTGLIVIPLLITLGLIIISKKDWGVRS